MFFLVFCELFLKVLLPPTNGVRQRGHFKLLVAFLIASKQCLWNTCPHANNSLPGGFAVMSSNAGPVIGLIQIGQRATSSSLDGIGGGGNDGSICAIGNDGSICAIGK